MATSVLHLPWEEPREGGSVKVAIAACCLFCQNRLCVCVRVCVLGERLG